MNTRKIPLRKCTGCGEMKNKREMIRVIRSPEEDILLDKTGKKNGRGAYICNSMDCLKQAVKTKGLERSLKIDIPKEIYDTLVRELEDS